MTYYYSYSGAEKTLDLSDCSAQLWPLLDEALRLGVTLIHTRASPRRGALRPTARSRSTSPARDGGGALVEAVLRVGDVTVDGLEPVLFLGRDGHGLVCSEPADGRDPRNPHLRLVRLARPAPMRLQKLLLDRECLTIPASDLERFADEISPALRGIATVISSDGSFTPPEISAPSSSCTQPTRTTTGSRSPGSGSTPSEATPHRVPLGASGPAFRDRGAERAILAATRIADTGLERFGLVDDGGRPAAAAVTLTGLDSLHLTTEELPRLAALPGLDVEVTGEPADYRDVGESLEIAVSTEELDGERDWFDLGVTISVEGRELPFAEVFTALANGESQMLLPDGAHFSLLDAAAAVAARADRRGPRARRPAVGRRCGSAATRRACGTSSPRSASSPSRRRRGSGRSARCSSSTRSPSTSCPRRCTRSCGPTSATASAGSRRSGSLELGGILADDMGLGKTLQALALICHARERDPDLGPFLVVAPTSVVSGWVGEAARFAPGLDRLRGGRHAREVGADDRRARGRRHRRDDVHAAPARRRRLPVRALGGRDPRRGAVRQEPPGHDLQVRPRARAPRSSSRSPARRWRTT